MLRHWLRHSATLCILHPELEDPAVSTVSPGISLYSPVVVSLYTHTHTHLHRQTHTLQIHIFSTHTHLWFFGLLHGDEPSWCVSGEDLLTVAKETQAGVHGNHLLTVPAESQQPVTPRGTQGQRAVRSPLKNYRGHCMQNWMASDVN